MTVAPGTSRPRRVDDHARHVVARLPARQPAAEQQVLDRGGVEVGDLVQRGLHDEGGEVVGPEVLERALVGAADGGARCGNDHCLGHGELRLLGGCTVSPHPSAAPRAQVCAGLGPSPDSSCSTLALTKARRRALGEQERREQDAVQRRDERLGGGAPLLARRLHHAAHGADEVVAPLGEALGEGRVAGGGDRQLEPGGQQVGLAEPPREEPGDLARRHARGRRGTTRAGHPVRPRRRPAGPRRRPPGRRRRASRVRK